MMQVREIMTSTVDAIPAHQPIADVAHAMRERAIGSLPVIEGDRLVGIITDRDIVVRVVADGLDPHMETAGFHMTRDPIVVEAGWPIERAAALMAQAQVRRLPVVEDGRLVGYLALSDVEAQQSKQPVPA